MISNTLRQQDSKWSPLEEALDGEKTLKFMSSMLLLYAIFRQDFCSF